VKESLGIPEEYRVIALVIVEMHSEAIHPYLMEKQAEVERERPQRLPLERFAYINRYTGGE